MQAEEGLRRLLEECQIASQSAPGRSLLGFLALLEKWNMQINLTGASRWNELEPFFREGIWASELYPIEAVSHLDIGSGAGFPAVILGILISRLELEMVESRVKRSVFLETVVRKASLQKARIHNERLDDFLGHCPNSKKWDCISWKGLKLGKNDLAKLLLHSKPDTQFWIFHGENLPVESASQVDFNLRLLRKEMFPSKRGWALSIYMPP